MKNFICRISLAILCIFSYSCQSPVSNNDIENNYVTCYTNEYNVTTILSIEKEKYSLDDTVSLKYTAINKSDTNRIHIHRNGGPLYDFRVFNKENELIQHYPPFRTTTMYNHYFTPGDTIKFSINWNQSILTLAGPPTLKVFSGKYLLMASYCGISTNNLGKWIEITEEGDPLSAKLYWHYSYSDSITMDLIVRNRISKKLNYSLKQNIPVKLHFYESYPNSLSKTIILNTNFDSIELLPKSNKTLIKYRALKKDLINDGLQGCYYCKIEIQCNSRSIEAISSGLIY